MTKINCFTLDMIFAPPMKEPSWSKNVPRWYQLDGAAFTLTELVHQVQPKVDSLILASPEASNVTDWEFVQTGCHKAQKFVHTLPNVRASMALQDLDHTCRLSCVQKGRDTLFAGFQEFWESEDELTALATVELLDWHEKGQQSYRASLFVQSEQGAWSLKKTDSKENDFNKQWKHFLENKFQSPSMLGPWTLEKIP